MKHPFYSALGIESRDSVIVKDVSKKLGISKHQMDYYDTNWILPNEEVLEKISEAFQISSSEFMLRMGIFDSELRRKIAIYSSEIDRMISGDPASKNNVHNSETKPLLVHTTELGKLFKGDCIEFLTKVESESYDLIFADPPFNLSKFYLSSIDDNLSLVEYIDWTEKWLSECVRVLKPGGSLFLWNIPKWNTFFSDFLNHRLTFRHWIATDIKFSLPISNRLYPSHYSLLYYVKGEQPKVFHPDRMPMEVCPKCLSDIKDYGGYKDKMNPKGINLTDVWDDIPPVRHKKYKGRPEANELSIKLMDRIIEMASNPGDIIFDPFGGSGTTYVVAEIKNRRWVGIELGPVDGIVSRLNEKEKEKEFLNKYRQDYNALFPKKIKEKRKQMKLWTDESFV